MRESDREEILNLRPHDSEFQLAFEVYTHISTSGRGVVSWHRGYPAALAGFTESYPGVWEVFMFGTDDFKDALFPLMRWIKTEAKAILSVCKGHRLQCDSRSTHHEAHKLIKSMGGVPESTMRSYGKDSSDYIRFVWFPETDDFLHPNYKMKKETA